MIKTEEYDNTTRQMVFVTTREWIAPNGHKVTIESRNTRRDGTINANINYTSTTRYTCECGKKHFTYRNAQKSVIINHDSWMTDAQREEASARLMALLNA